MKQANGDRQLTNSAVDVTFPPKLLVSTPRCIGLCSSLITTANSSVVAFAKAAIISPQIPHTWRRLISHDEKRLFNVNSWESKQTRSNSGVNELEHQYSKAIFKKKMIKSFATSSAQLLGKLIADVRCHICASARERNALFTSKLRHLELKLFSSEGWCHEADGMLLSRTAEADLVEGG